MFIIRGYHCARPLLAMPSIACACLNARASDSDAHAELMYAMRRSDEQSLRLLISRRFASAKDARLLRL